MSSSNKKIVLKKLKEHNTIWHPESTVVFKSQSERLVIGRYVEGELIPLDEAALDICEEWKFKPDESLLEVGEEEQDEEEKVDKGNGEEDEENNEKEKESVEDEKVDEGNDDKENKDDEEEKEEKEEKEEEEEEEEEEEDKGNIEENVKKETTISLQFGNISGDVSHLLQNKLFSVLDNIQKNFGEVLDEKYEKTLKNMSNHYEEKIEVLQGELLKTKEELEKIRQQYNGIKQKFDAMKSLFN